MKMPRMILNGLKMVALLTVVMGCTLEKRAMQPPPTDDDHAAAAVSKTETPKDQASTIAFAK